MQLLELLQAHYREASRQVMISEADVCRLTSPVLEERENPCADV
jgi:hypothetical protein